MHTSRLLLRPAVRGCIVCMLICTRCTYAYDVLTHTHTCEVCVCVCISCAHMHTLSGVRCVRAVMLVCVALHR